MKLSIVPCNNGLITDGNSFLKWPYRYENLEILEKVFACLELRAELS